MERLKLITICAVAGLLLITAAPAMADDPCSPSWRGQEGTLYAAWNSWTGFAGPMPPADDWESNPSGLASPQAYAYGAALKATWYGRSQVLKLTADDQLKFYMPNFGSDNDYKEIWMQVTYLKDSLQYPLFTVVTEEEVSMTKVPFLEYSVVWGTTNWVTEAWSFQLSPNPEWEEIWLNFSSYYSYAYVDQVVIDTWCTSSIPEPATMALLGLGAIGLLRRKKT